jgi:hypothetical protein
VSALFSQGERWLMSELGSVNRPERIWEEVVKMVF